MAQERIHKIIADAGILSRRKAEEAIRQGRVTLNDQVVTKLGTKADPSKDLIRVDDQRVKLKTENQVILFHKPKNVITTRSDPEGRPTVYEYLPHFYRSLKSVGRLDFLSEGLLIFTNDGELAYHLTHPRFKVEKKYLVKIKEPLDDKKIQKLQRKIQLDDGPGKFKSITCTQLNNKTGVYEIVISEGRNRFIRRMIEALGHSVLKLKRTEMGPFKLDKLPPGKFEEIKKERLLKIYKKISLARE